MNRVRVPRFLAPVTPEPLRRDLPALDAARMDFAQRVVGRLINGSVRVAVINEHGRPALVSTGEALYDTLSKDHDIVGVYKTGARVRDVMDDLRAAGL